MPFVEDEVVTAAKLNMATFISSATNGSTRTFTNTGFLDLDALTGGAGSMAAVAVTATTGTSALVIVTATTFGASSAVVNVDVRVSGASTIAAANGQTLVNANTAQAHWSAARVVTGLTAGSNTFELQARVNVGTGSIGTPTLIVMGIV